MPGAFEIKVARFGQDVSRCPDNKLLFDNRWPTLKIFAQGSFTVVDTGAAGTYATIFTHDLGYYPVFNCFFDDGNGRYFTSAGNIEMSTTNLRFYYTGSDATVTIYFFIYLIDLETQIDASNVRLSLTDSQGKDRHNVMEVAKASKDIKNIQAEDYVSSGKYISLIIHKLVNGTKTAGDYTVAHGLGYEPMNWFFGKGVTISFAGYRNLSGIGSDHYVYADDTNFHSVDGYEYTYSLIILKEPIS